MSKLLFAKVSLDQQEIIAGGKITVNAPVTTNVTTNVAINIGVALVVGTRNRVKIGQSNSIQS
jgi:hypothetical protein